VGKTPLDGGKWKRADGMGPTCIPLHSVLTHLPDKFTPGSRSHSGDILSFRFPRPLNSLARPSEGANGVFQRECQPLLVF